jgi:hypothetical protein
MGNEDREMMNLTTREQICLEFLSMGLMEATSHQIGKAIYARMNGNGGSNLTAIGANVVGRLRPRGLVMFLSDLNAWRITKAGREAFERLTLMARVRGRPE